MTFVSIYVKVAKEAFEFFNFYFIFKTIKSSSFGEDAGHNKDRGIKQLDNIIFEMFLVLIQP